MRERPRLSLWEYITLLVAVSKTVAVALGTIVTALFRGRKGASTYKNHIVYQALRTYLSSTSTRQIQAITPSTSETYEAYVKSKKLTPQVVKFGDTVGCWFGDKKAQYVLLWLHGGGYAMMGGAGHMVSLHNLVEEASKKGKSLAVFLPQYDVSPAAEFPVQLVQTVAAFDYLTKDIGLKLSKIFIGGDSAGGNLALALLSHILHPRSDVPAVSVGEQKFAGAVLISPWVTFDQTAPAFKTNASKDILYGPVLKKWSDAFMGEAARDNYTYPLDAAPEWWKGLPVGETLVLTGGDELLVDDVKIFAEKLKKHNDKVELYVGEGEPHDPPLVEGMTAAAPGKVTKWFFEFVTTRI